MFFELIGTIVAGAAAALGFWAVNRTLKGRLPKWLMPVAAGLAMLLATISSEYGWYERSVAALPPGMVVAETVEERAFYRPWTYAWPFVTRFVAVNQGGARSHADHPDQRLVDLVFYGRWARTARVPVLFDCAGARRADLMDGADFRADGTVEDDQWRAIAADDPVLRAACTES